MKIEIEIPDELARVLSERNADLPRAALEALALEGYRSMLLTSGQVRRLLGFSTRIEVHEFLKERGVHLHYTHADLEQDRFASEESAASRSPHAA
jgi:predicted HTH domain antitoxin